MCQLAVRNHVEICPTFRLCSRGWVKAVFAEALGEEVELVQALGRGDECSEPVVRDPLDPQEAIAKQ